MSEIFVKNILPILESKQKQITPDLLKKFTSNYLVKNDNHFSPTGNKLWAVPNMVQMYKYSETCDLGQLH